MGEQRGGRLRLVLIAAGVGAVVAAVVAEAAASYPWPVRPVGEQHLITGNFGDPRGRTFHFGIDIRAAPGTPVYATISGAVYRQPSNPYVVGITNGRVHHEYWHVVPVAAAGAPATARSTVVGRVQPRFNHVHLSELRDGVYVHPLRPGALAPYVDETSPSVRAIVFERAGRRISPRAVRGRVSVVVDAFDWPALPREIRGADRNARVSPAVLRWRIQRGTRGVTPWHTAVDFRRRLPPNTAYGSVYAPGTRQNWRYVHGIFRFFLLRDWPASALRNGRYSLVVVSADVQGNSARARLPFVVAN